MLSCHLQYERELFTEKSWLENLRTIKIQTYKTSKSRVFQKQNSLESVE